MIGFERSNSHIAGTWVPLSNGDAQISCVECGTIINLNHQINDEGIVYPAVTCFVCGFHEWIKLYGWSPLRNK